jgi:hypothetical protein
MRIDSSGNLLVGITALNPISGGAVVSNAGYIQTSRGTTSLAAQIEFRNPNGVVGSVQTENSTTTYNTSSDYRLKENVQPMTDGLATISALKPVRYDWISAKSAGEGFIAHELQSVIPYAVTGEKDAVDEDGKPVLQGVDYSKIVVHLVAACQELKAEIDALKGAK